MTDAELLAAIEAAMEELDLDDDDLISDLLDALDEDEDDEEAEGEEEDED